MADNCLQRDVKFARKRHPKKPFPLIGQRFSLAWRNNAVATVTGLPYGTGVDLVTDDGIEIFICGDDWREWMKNVKPL